MGSIIEFELRMSFDTRKIVVKSHTETEYVDRTVNGLELLLYSGQLAGKIQL